MTTISFTGDIAFSKHFTGQWADPQLIDQQLLDFLLDSDHVVPNVEGALTDKVMVRGDAATPAHASDPRSAAWLLKMGGDIWNLANNHTLDCGKEGLADTVALAQANGCRPIGAGMNTEEARKPILWPEAGGIGLFSLCYKDIFKAGDNRPGCIHWDDEVYIRQTISEIKTTCRWCILIVHGGEEFSELPMPHVREKYLRWLD